MTDLKLSWKAWTSGPFYSAHAALHVIAIWGIWLDQNKKLFDDILILAQVYAGRNFGIFKAFPLQVSLKSVRVNSIPIVDVSFLWALVDGASQGQPRFSGAGGIIHLSSSRSIHFAAGLRDATNNQAEFVVVKILLRRSLSLGMDRL